MADDKEAKILDLTAHIVAAYIQNNPVPVAALPDLIASVSASISGIGGKTPTEPVALTPAVNPKKSVFPDYIISLEDGLKFKSMKRALMSRYGLTPVEYRAKWNLPLDYPMVAPNYAASRSEMAKRLGLGRKAAPPPAPKKATAAAKRGRAKKA